MSKAAKRKKKITLRVPAEYRWYIREISRRTGLKAGDVVSVMLASYMLTHKRGDAQQADDHERASA